MTAALSADSEAMLRHFQISDRTLTEGRWPPRYKIQDRARVALDDLTQRGLLDYVQHRNGTAVWTLTDAGIKARTDFAPTERLKVIVYKTLARELKILDVKGRIA